MNEYETIEKAKLGFEAAFAEGERYNSQTNDKEHLNRILSKLPLQGSLLDLGTGSGYLAFPIAQKNPDCRVFGLDIVTSTLDRNRERAENLGLTNLNFISYDGLALPFENNRFDTIVTRYALHHFPDIKNAFAELARVLKPGGCLFISDPAPNDNDTDHFVDRYMQMKDDGHVRFYTLAEYENLAKGFGIELKDAFISQIRFSRKEPDRYEKLLNETDKSVIEGYAIQIINDEIYITEKVNNLFFVRVG